MTKLTLLLGLVVIVAILVSEIECRRQRRGKWRGRWAKRRGIGRVGVDLDRENEAVGLQHAQVETNSTDIPQRQKWRLQKRKQKFLKKLQRKNKKFQMRLEKLGQIETNNTADDMAIQPPAVAGVQISQFDAISGVCVSANALGVSVYLRRTWQNYKN